MYIYKTETGFGFTDIPMDGVVPISQENYNRFFREQSQGKQFKLKDINSSVFKEIFEEYIPEVVETEPVKTIEDYTLELDFRLTMLEIMGGM